MAELTTKTLDSKTLGIGALVGAAATVVAVALMGAGTVATKADAYNVADETAAEHLGFTKENGAWVLHGEFTVTSKLTDLEPVRGRATATPSAALITQCVPSMAKELLPALAAGQKINATIK